MRTQDEVGMLAPREASVRNTTYSVHSPARSGVLISHDVSKTIVEGAHPSDDAADLLPPTSKDALASCPYP